MLRLLGCAALLLCSAFATATHAQGTGTGRVRISFDFNDTLATTSGKLGITATTRPLSAPGGSGQPIPSPTGTVTLLDSGNALNPGGVALTADPSLTSLGFQAGIGAVDPELAVLAQGEVAGDFHGDSRPDLLVYGSNAAGLLVVQAFVSVPLSGITSVTVPFPSSLAGLSPLPPQTLALPRNLAPAVLDVNGDGKLDLLVGNTVAYGNGDGTFGNVSVLSQLASGYGQTYAVDVNGDGMLDIVAVNAPPDPASSAEPVQYSFTVLRNDGSGSFTSLGSFPLAAAIPAGSYATFNIYGLSFADLNGDGKPDVISQSNAVPSGSSAGGNNLYTALNNGDGTFAAPVLVSNDTTESVAYVATAFGDMNSDGKTDMVLAYAQNVGGNYLAVYPGQGDGTFAAPTTLLLDQPLTPVATMQSVALLDLNADGHLDAVSGTGQVALGDGHGGLTLSSPLFPELTNANGTVLGYPLLEGMFAEGPLPTLVYLNLTSANASVFLPVVSSTAKFQVPIAPGTHVLSLQYSGDNNYANQTTEPIQLTVGPINTQITLTSSPAPPYVGQNISFTASLTSSFVFVPTGTVTFSDQYSGGNPLSPVLNPTTTPLGTVPVTNAIATFSTNQLGPGIHTIIASYSGDGVDAASTAQFVETVNVPFNVSGSTGTSSVSLTTPSGQTATAPLTVTPANGFAGSVTLSCYGLPANASCAFSPATAQLTGSGSAAVTLTISTATTVSTSAYERGLSGATILACGVPLLGLLCLSPRSRRRVLPVALAMVAMSGLACIGCGGGGTKQPTQTAGQALEKTPPGTYSVYILATSSQSTTATNLQLTVQ